MSDATSQLESTSSESAYGSFLARFRALLLDSVVMVVAFVLILFSAAATDIAGAGRVAVFGLAALFLLYEPVMVAHWGGTLGHRWANLRVVSENTGGNPGFWRAFFRFIVKSVLGLPSFIFMALTRRHQALHDRVAGTTVRIHDLSSAREMDVAWERSEAQLEPTGIPSRRRRVLAIVTYTAASFVLLSIISSFSASEACLVSGQCTAVEDLQLQILGFGWLAVIAFIVIAGWRGHLWGARVRAQSAHAPGA